jgi:hypothetical protein
MGVFKELLIDHSFDGKSLHANVVVVTGQPLACQDRNQTRQP